ncbi:Calcium-transporting ATPase 10 plasma membrane-type [Bienertia sinuspersici]
MEDEYKGSPYRRHKDVEAGGSNRSGDYSDDEGGFSPFDITTTKNAPIERLKRWRIGRVGKEWRD